MTTQAAEKAAPTKRKRAPSQSVKRGRGRPRKEKSKEEEAVVAAALADAKASVKVDGNGADARATAVTGAATESMIDDGTANKNITHGVQSAGEDENDSKEDKDDDATLLSRMEIERTSTQQWSKTEDAQLTALINKFGAKRWSFIAGCLRGRKGKQCRDRYLNHLRPGIKTGEWTREEEKVLVEGHKILGSKWAALAKLLVGRPENAIKNHWHATMRCKWNKGGEVDENTLTELQRYQMSLKSTNQKAIIPTAARATPAASEDRKDTKARRNAAKAKDTTPKDPYVSRSIFSAMEALVNKGEAKKRVKSETPTDSGKTTTTAPTSDAMGDAAAVDKAAAEEDGKTAGVNKEDNVDVEDSSISGMTTSYQNTRYTHTERLEIDGNIEVVREKMAKDLERISAVSEATAEHPATAPRHSVVASTASAPNETAALGKEASDTAKPAKEKVADFIQVSENSIIDVGRCVSIVSSVGSSEVSTLTSVATQDGVSFIQGDHTLTRAVIAQGLRNIAEVIRAKWPVHRIALAVRVGVMAVGDITLCICVAGDEWTDVVAASEFASTQVKNKYRFSELKASHDERANDDRTHA